MPFKWKSSRSNASATGDTGLAADNTEPGSGHAEGTMPTGPSPPSGVVFRVQQVFTIMRGFKGDRLAIGTLEKGTITRLDELRVVRGQAHRPDAASVQVIDIMVRRASVPQVVTGEIAALSLRARGEGPESNPSDSSNRTVQLAKGDLLVSR